MTENLGTPREKVTEQFGPETTEESEQERIKRLSPGVNLARTTMVTRGGTRFIEEMPPESFKEGLMGSLVPEKKEAMQQEQQAMAEQLGKTQDLVAQQTITQAGEKITPQNWAQAQAFNATKGGTQEMNARQMFFQETKALIKNFGRMIGIGKKFQLSSAEVGSRYDKIINDIQNSLDTGGDPLNAEQTLQQLEQDLAQVASVIQVESKYDIGAMIDGVTTEDQVKLADLQRKINFLRMRIQMSGLGAR